MLAANGWAEEMGLPGFHRLKERKRIEIFGGKRRNRLRAVGKIFQKCRQKGKAEPTEGQPESVLGSKTNALYRR